MVQRTSIFVEIHRDDPNLGAAHRNIIPIPKHPQNISVRRTLNITERTSAKICIN